MSAHSFARSVVERLEEDGLIGGTESIALRVALGDLPESDFDDEMLAVYAYRPEGVA